MKNKTSRQKNKKTVDVRKFDTKIEVIEKKHGVSLGVNSNMKLGDYLKQKGYPSLAEMLTA